MLDSGGEIVARGQQYSSGVVQLLVLLVLRNSVSLRASVGVLTMFERVAGLVGRDLHWTTGRLWLLRIGLAMLQRPKEIADDWVWVIDHSIQIGQCKCMVILGIRLSRMPAGRALRHQDMELIALEPMNCSNKITVDECLEANVAKTGAPFAMLSDHGADLHAGIERFRQRHPRTVELYDIKHKAACLVKAELEKDPQWKSFAAQAGSSKSSMQQTELAPLVSPNQRSKSRFMNLAPLADWGADTLELLDQPQRLLAAGITAERAEKALGWLRDYAQPLRKWEEMHDTVGRALEFARLNGYYSQAGADLAKELPTPATPEAARLRERIIEFVTEQSSGLDPERRPPATSEVIESCFGKLKNLEQDQSKSGFTGMVLSLGAMVSDLTVETIHQALESCRVSDVLDWCKEKLGTSVQAKQRSLYASPAGATKTG